MFAAMYNDGDVVGPSVDTHLVFCVVLAVVAIVVGDGDGVLLLKKTHRKHRDDC